MKYSLIVLSLCFGMAQAENQASSKGSTDKVKLIDSLIAPKPIKRVPPKFPVSAARNGNEGWVKMSFVVDKEGNVVDPVIRDSSGIKGFEKESLRAIKKWKYSPAIRDGQAIEQCQNSVQLDFKLNKGIKGARRTFITQYKKANAALEEGNIELAQTLIAKMQDGKIWNGYEDTWFWMLKSSLFNAQENDKGYLDSLRRALASSDAKEYLGANSYLSLQEQRFMYEVKATLYEDALATFSIIEQLPDNTESIAALEKYAAQVRQTLKESPFLLVNAETGNDGSWWHTLSRNKFSFTDIQGKIDSVEVRCANKREKYTVAENNQWGIPQSWGRCSLLVTGDGNTSFNLVEIRNDA